MIAGFTATQVVGVATRLGLPELLAGGPRSVSELAEQTEVDPDGLHRLLRHMASLGVASVHDEGVFGPTELCEHLRQVPFELAFGQDRFRWLAAHPEQDAAWNSWMTQTEPAWLRDAGVLDAVAWPADGVIVDLGRGEGRVLASLPGPRPSLRGVLSTSRPSSSPARPPCWVRPGWPTG
jgi:hypothetical protein